MIHILLAGDSTLTPTKGWGGAAQGLFDRAKAAVQNLAVDGASTKSFALTPNYTTLLESLAPGTWLFIEFGHNDEKTGDSARGTTVCNGDAKETPGSFKYYLYKKFVKPAREKKAKPVLLTPTTRRNPDTGLGITKTALYKQDDYAYPLYHDDYAGAIKALGAELNIPVIDLYAKTQGLYQDLVARGGPQATAALLLPDDMTHFNSTGAAHIAALVAAGIRETPALSDLAAALL